MRCVGSHAKQSRRPRPVHPAATGTEPARRGLAITVVAAALLAGAAAVGPAPARAASGYPTAPPAQICGNKTVLDGPASQPKGSVRVDPGQNLQTLTQAKPAGTTFWLAPGQHKLGSDEWAQVIPKDNNVYVGAPGAVIDGGGVNRYAFTQRARNVVIRHLTIQNFGAPGTNNNEGVVNHDSGTGWTIELNTIRNNAGAGVMIGNDNTLRSNCLADNGQYGLSTYIPEGVFNVTVDRNEITGNNRDDWEKRIQYCGCSGASKFWNVTGAAVTNNWVHHNRGSGIWADTNNAGFRIEGNYINDNDAEGIFYEISYNARIANNTLKRNALVKGKEFASKGENFPIGAIYISESGGDTRLNSGVYSTFEITDNRLEDNWGGVVLFENSDRFCNSPANTSSAYCTKGGTATLQTCVEGTIEKDPYFSDCRWKTQNVSVTANDFLMDKAAIGCTTGCGHQALLSNWGTFPSWSPYKARTVQDAITYKQNNRFRSNHYVGDWKFLPYETANYQSFSDWQSRYAQDEGSTWVPAPGATTSTTAPSTTTTTVVPAVTGNALDPATANLETSGSQWTPWFSATTSVTSEQARTGMRSLKVEVTASHGWGVTQQNFPGFTTGPGPKKIGFSGRAGSGPSLAATMWVRWRDSGGAELRTDSVGIPALGDTWQDASVAVTAPAGTAKVGVDFTNSSGVAGNFLYVDDVFVAGDSGTAGESPTTTTTTVAPTTTTTVAPTTTTTVAPTTTTTVPSSPVNALDADTAGLEGSTGVWVPWFSTSVASSNEQARSGSRSLKVSITAPHGWGVAQSNWPGFVTAPGEKTISFWGRAGTGSGLAATMWVHWRDSGNAVLRTDSVTLDLGPSWARATANVVAPPGTTRVAVDFTHPSGVADNTLYLDDIAVVSASTTTTTSTTTTVPSTTTTTIAPLPLNLLDSNTGGLEGSTGVWVPWFSTTVSRSTEQAHTGSASLKVAVTAPHGWGVTQQNFPGFVALAGPKTISFWGRAGSGTGLSATMWVHWRNAAGADIRVDSITLPLSTTWRQAISNVTAPIGTVTVGVDFTNSAGVAGNTLYLDDIVIS